MPTCRDCHTPSALLVFCQLSDFDPHTSHPAFTVHQDLQTLSRTAAHTSLVVACVRTEIAVGLNALQATHTLPLLSTRICTACTVYRNLYCLYCSPESCLPESQNLIMSTRIMSTRIIRIRTASTIYQNLRTLSNLASPHAH